MDVWTAQCDTAAQIAPAYPHLCGTGFDLPQVGPTFEDEVGGLSVSGRLSFAAGNFFEDPLPYADVIIMGHFLRDWDLPAAGALVVFEAMIDDDRNPSAFGLMMSLNMLIETEGGFDDPGADCQGWMREAGFGKTRVEHLAARDSMAIAIKS